MLGLEYPLFLAGLGLLGIPILAHLMHRRLPRRLVFPTIRFLRRAELPPEGRRRLRDLALLALRLGAVAAAVLAFSRPYFRPRSPTVAASAAGGSVTVFLVDRSASMGAREVPRRTLELLRAELARLEPGENAGLVLSADRVLEVLPPGAAPAELLDRLAATPPLNTAGDHAAAVRQAAAFLDRDGPRRLVILSDLQLPDWQNCRDPLPPRTQVRILNPSEPPPANVALAGASVAATAPGRCRVTLDVRNLSDSPQERQVTVRIGQERQTTTVSLPPLQARRVAVALPADATVHGVAELSPDDYEADDTLHFWAAAPPPVTVLAAVPGNADGERDVQAFFLAKALESSIPGTPQAFAVRTVTADAFPALDLSSVPLVFVLGAADRFDQAGFQHLRAFCEGGGTAVCTPGPYPAQMIHGLRTHGLFASRLVAVAEVSRLRGEGCALGWINPQTPLAQAFTDAESTDLFLFSIRQYLRLETASGQTVHLKTAGGDPVLIEQALGRGRLLVLALALDPHWSDLPLSTSFVPLVQEIARDAVPSGHGVTRLECGQPLPEFRNLLGEPATAGGAATAWSTSEPGVFAVGDRPVEVNVSRRESSPERMAPFELARRLTPEAPDPVAGASPATESAPARTIPLWPAVALLTAALLLAEMVLTFWTDRREVRARMPGVP